MDQQEAGSEGVLKENMEERAERLALYIIENRTTVRAAAQKFGISFLPSFSMPSLARACSMYSAGRYTAGSPQ